MTDPVAESSPEVAFYVTFSGEAGKGGAAPIDNVVGFGADGRVVAPAVLRRLARGLKLHILRGMAFGPDGHLYVANAHRRHSMILTFGPPNPDGTRDMVGDKPFAHHGKRDVALIHPYGMVWDRHGHLLVTVQDTVVVTRFQPDRQVGPIADFLQHEFGHIPFLPGTHVASAVEADHLPPPVPVERGGLRCPRGIAYSRTRHTIYVADEAVRAVRSYTADTGHFLGDVLVDPPHHGHPIGLHLRDDVLYVGLKKANRVLAIDLADNHAETVVHHRHGDVALRHPSGIAFGADGLLYVGSLEGFQILRYDLADGAAEVFADNLSDTPEHILALPSSRPATAAPLAPPSPP